MPLNTNIPQPLQSLGQTWLQIQQNFNNIESGFTVNHVDWNSGDDTGKHNLVSMPVQAADPVTPALEMALYTKNVSGVAQMFIAPESAGTVRNITGAYIVPAGPFTTGSQGSTTLPSGLILKWGFNTVTNSTTVSFAPTGVFPNNLFSVVLTPGGFVTGFLNVSTRNVNLFGVDCSTSLMTSFYWFAIGN